MSYSEGKDGAVILTMSREDYELAHTFFYIAEQRLMPGDKDRLNSLLDRLNSGNEKYTPYRTGANTIACTK